MSSSETLPFYEYVHRSTITFRCFEDVPKSPVSFASAFILTSEGKRLLITAKHCIRRARRYGIEVGYDPTIKQTIIYGPGNPDLCKIFCGTKTRNVDIACWRIPSNLSISRPIFDSSTLQHLKDEKMLAISIQDIAKPTTKSLYCFTGSTRAVQTNHPGLTEVETLAPFHKDLTYVKDLGAFHVFKLSLAHPGHTAFKGCSGAPIFDVDGNVVSLVSFGRKDRDQIFGVNLSLLRSYIHTLMKS